MTRRISLIKPNGQVISITLSDWLTWVPGDVTYAKSLDTNLSQSEYIVIRSGAAATW